MLDRLYHLAGKVLSLRGIPRTLSPPDLPEDLEQATYAQLRRYVIYLMKTCRRLSEDPQLDRADRDIAADRAASLAETLGAHPLLDDLKRAIRASTTWEQGHGRLVALRS